MTITISALAALMITTAILARRPACRAIEALCAIGTATSLNKLITSIANPNHPYRKQILDAVEMAFHNDSFPVPLDQSSISNALLQAAPSVNIDGPPGWAHAQE